MDLTQTTNLTRYHSALLHERISTLVTVDNQHRRKIVRASQGSYFTDIYSSDRDVINFLTPVMEQGLCIMSAAFDETKDWVIVSESTSYATKAKASLILGNDRYEDVADVVQSVLAARQAHRQIASTPRDRFPSIQRFSLMAYLEEHLPPLKPLAFDEYN